MVRKSQLVVVDRSHIKQFWMVNDIQAGFFILLVNLNFFNLKRLFDLFRQEFFHPDVSHTYCLRMFAAIIQLVNQLLLKLLQNFVLPHVVEKIVLLGVYLIF